MVYFIQEGDSGPIKIGKTVDPHGRLAQLQTGNPSSLHLLLAVRGGTKRERKLHERLGDYRLRDDGEWFAPEPAVFREMERVQRDDEEAFVTIQGRTYPVVRREAGEERCEPCPYCGAKHIHGAADGHRSAHCRTPTFEEKYELEKKTGRKEWYVKAPGGEIIYSERGYVIQTRHNLPKCV